MKHLSLTRKSRRGSALVASLLIAAVLATIAAIAFKLSLVQTQETSAQGEELRAFYMAEAGLSETVRQVSVQVDQNQPVPLAVGSYGAPMALKEGYYWSTIADNGDETYTVRATGQVGTALRTLEAVVARVEGGIFDHAIFAGNSSDDPNYTLRLSGVGAMGDVVTGDIYSGNNIEIVEDSTLTGDAYSRGTTTGVSGREGVTRPIPDIAAMNYEVNHDFDVATMFGAATSATNALGGIALQLPESSPAHIFRKNPSDRLSEINGTPKDDFFLEDPYQAVGDYTTFNGTQGHTISLSGTMGEPGISGTNRVYYIDGNLWVHNPSFYTMRFLNTDAAGVKLTFVVKGNVYFSDDVDLGDPSKDGVAFIAIKDENEPDSGNVYLGDPRYGTLNRMQAYLYAEEDFYDYNLSATGSSTVEVFGNMTAGDHVAIKRDFVNPDGSVVHSKLTVNFDDRLSTGALVLPGLPGNVDEGVGGMTVVFWKEIATP